MEKSILFIIETETFQSQPIREALQACVRDIHGIQSEALTALNATAYILHGNGTLLLLARLVDIAHRKGFRSKALWIDRHANWLT